MNCFILVLLLLCSQNNSGSGNCGTTGRNGKKQKESGCGCSTAKENSCGCRNDSLIEPRNFPSFQSSTCGCEESKPEQSCNCCQ